MKKPFIAQLGTPNFPENLFWDVDFNEIDWEKNKRWVVERVLLSGGWEEFKELNRYYSEEEIKENIIKIRYLDAKTLNFVSNFYNIPKENFKCFTLKQLNLQLWG